MTRYQKFFSTRKRLQNQFLLIFFAVVLLAIFLPSFAAKTWPAPAPLIWGGILAFYFSMFETKKDNKLFVSNMGRVLIFLGIAIWFLT